MTKDEILAMEAGPELDALVAERVMGLTAIEPALFYYFIDTKRQYSKGSPPKYSTDIAAAWEVVEKLRAIGKLEIIDYGSEGWGIYYEDARDRDADATAVTVPLAICTVALLTTL